MILGDPNSVAPGWILNRGIGSKRGRTLSEILMVTLNFYFTKQLFVEFSQLSFVILIYIHLLHRIPITVERFRTVRFPNADKYN